MEIVCIQFGVTQKKYLSRIQTVVLWIYKGICLIGNENSIFAKPVKPALSIYLKTLCAILKLYRIF